jgi:hypothetical protein
VTWQCCNCAKDIRFGVTTLSAAQYEKTACFQCKNRPKEVVARMRAENYVAPIPRHLDPQYQVSKRGVVLTGICVVLLVALAVGSYWVGNTACFTAMPFLNPAPPSASPALSTLICPLTLGAKS